MTHNDMITVGSVIGFLIVVACIAMMLSVSERDQGLANPGSSTIQRIGVAD